MHSFANHESIVLCLWVVLPKVFSAENHFELTWDHGRPSAKATTSAGCHGGRPWCLHLLILVAFVVFGCSECFWFASDDELSALICETRLLDLLVKLFRLLSVVFWRASPIYSLLFVLVYGIMPCSGVCTGVSVLWSHGLCRMMSIINSASGLSLSVIFPFIFLLRLFKLVMRFPAVCGPCFVA